MRGVSSGSRPISTAFFSAGPWRAREALGSPAVGPACSMWLFQPPSATTPLPAAPVGRASPQADPTPLPAGPAPASACPNHLHPAWPQPRPWATPWLPRPARRSAGESCPGKGHLLPSASPWWGQEEAWGLPVVCGGGGGEGRRLGTAPIIHLGNRSSS